MSSKARARRQVNVMLVPMHMLTSAVAVQDRRTGENACAATAAPELTKPCARNTFVLTKYTSPRLDIGTTHYDDDVLRYGQKVRVVANSAVRGEELDSGGGSAPLCLFSKPVCPTHFAKYSHHQVRALAHSASSNAPPACALVDSGRESHGVQQHNRNA